MKNYGSVTVQYNVTLCLLRVGHKLLVGAAATPPNNCPASCPRHCWFPKISIRTAHQVRKVVSLNSQLHGADPGYWAPGHQPTEAFYFRSVAFRGVVFDSVVM
jgi:hypothetical protein